MECPGIVTMIARYVLSCAHQTVAYTRADLADLNHGADDSREVATDTERLSSLAVLSRSSFEKSCATWPSVALF